MAIKKNIKNQPEESYRKPLFSEELLFRIKNIVEQTGISQTDLFLKWVLQEESWIGLIQSAQGQTASQSKTVVNKPVQKVKGTKDASAKDDRKELVKKAEALKKKGLSYKKIAEIFNDEKIPTMSGAGKWYASSTSNLLKSKK